MITVRCQARFASLVKVEFGQPNFEKKVNISLSVDMYYFVIALSLKLFSFAMDDSLDLVFGNNARASLIRSLTFHLKVLTNLGWELKVR